MDEPIDARGTRSPVCQAPGCERKREPWQLLCTPCWKALPADLRATFWSTKPRSDERIQMCREVLRYVRDRAGQEELL